MGTERVTQLKNLNDCFECDRYLLSLDGNRISDQKIPHRFRNLGDYLFGRRHFPFYPDRYDYLFGRSVLGVDPTVLIPRAPAFVKSDGRRAFTLEPIF